ncbi:hypothetical protein BDZ97DRAFT_129642 [Flammula alnicola]|nr:hypothetical protein BDZ97DRAFT_129642 [Flammula alnicola]
MADYIVSTSITANVDLFEHSLSQFLRALSSVLQLSTMTSVKTPSVLWAQRSSATTKQKNFIYLTVNLRGIMHSTLKYTVTDTTISLKVNAKEGDEQCEYAFELDFHAEVVPKALEKCKTPQSVTIVIFKKDITARDWPQLSKTVLAYVKTDFSRWTWEGDESDDVDEDGSTDIINVDMDSSSAGTKNGGLLKQSNQGSAPPSVTTPATPQVLWAQRSSPTESMKLMLKTLQNPL